MNSSEYPLPVVHLNGSSKRLLLEGYNETLVEINKAIEKFLLIECHGRDYYPISNSAYSRASAERAKNYKKLLDVKEYLSKHVESLENQ